MCPEIDRTRSNMRIPTKDPRYVVEVATTQNDWLTTHYIDSLTIDHATSFQDYRWRTRAQESLGSRANDPCKVSRLSLSMRDDERHIFLAAGPDLTNLLFDMWLTDALQLVTLSMRPTRFPTTTWSSTMRSAPLLVW
jgi:hypothetical protein